MSDPRRYPLRDLDPTEFTFDAPTALTKRSVPPSPVKLSPTKRRLLGHEGVRFRAYASPYPVPVSISSSQHPPSNDAESSLPQPSSSTAQMDYRVNETLGTAPSESAMEHASLDPSSPHYCGFMIFRDPTCNRNPHPAPAEPLEEEDQHKENVLPTRSLKLARGLSPKVVPASAPTKLVFPGPCPIELGDRVSTTHIERVTPLSSSPSISSSEKRRRKDILAAELDNDLDVDY